MGPNEKDDKEEGFTPTGPALDTSGKLQGSVAQVPKSRPPPPRPRAETLELEERPPRPDTHYVAPPPPPPARLPSRGGGGLVVAVLLLACLAAGGWYFLFRESVPANRVPIAVVVLITSEPLGAAVSVEGTPVGVTPWAADNTWPVGPVNVTLSYPGYRPWNGTFRGGRPARLEARLQRR